MENGAEINAKDRDNITPLHWSVSEEMSKLLIENGANISAQDNSGQTPLYKAISYGHLSVVDILLKRDVDLYCNSNLIDNLKFSFDYFPEAKKAICFLISHLTKLHLLGQLSEENYSIWKSTMLDKSYDLENFV